MWDRSVSLVWCEGHTMFQCGWKKGQWWSLLLDTDWYVKLLNSVEITKKTVKFIFTKKTVKFINSYQVLFFTKTNEDITVLLVEIYFHKD